MKFPPTIDVYGGPTYGKTCSCDPSFPVWEIKMLTANKIQRNQPVRRRRDWLVVERMPVSRQIQLSKISARAHCRLPS